MIWLLACDGEAAPPAPAPKPVVVETPAAPPSAPAPEAPPPPPAAPPRPGEGGAADPWRAALATLSPADPAAATALVDSRIAARTTQNAAIVGARYSLVAAVLAGDAGTGAAWARLRAAEEALLRDERTFIWTWFDAVGTVPAGQADELILPAFAALREDVRVTLPRDTEATAAVGAVRYRLAGAALAVDAAWDAARVATEAFDPADRAPTDRALVALAAALVQFQGEKIEQLGWLRKQLGAEAWNKLARSWDIAQALRPLTIGASPLDPGSLAGSVLSGEGGAADPVNDQQAATRRAWEVGKP